MENSKEEGMEREVVIREERGTFRLHVKMRKSQGEEEKRGERGTSQQTRERRKRTDPAFCGGDRRWRKNQ